MTTATTTAQLAMLTSRFAALTTDIDQLLARPMPPTARIFWQTLRWGTDTLAGLFEAIRDAYARLVVALDVVAPALGTTTTALLAADGVTATPVEVWEALAARLGGACAGVDDLGCIALALDDLHGQPAYAPLNALLAARVLAALRAELDASFSPDGQDLASLLSLWQALDAGRDANGVLSIAHILAVGAQQQNPAVRAAIEARLSVAHLQPLPAPSGYRLVSVDTGPTQFTFDLDVPGGAGRISGRVTRQSVGDGLEDTYIWLPITLYGTFAGMREAARPLQSRYAYLALHLAWDLHPHSAQAGNIPLDLTMMLALLYRGELGTNTGPSGLVRLEAFARTVTPLICGSGLLCTDVEPLIVTLSQLEFWYNRVEQVDEAGVPSAQGPWARTRIDGVTGGRGLLMEARMTRLLADSLVSNAGGQGVGPFAVAGYVSSLFTDAERRAWLLPPGQRADRPSRWGNVVVPKASAPNRTTAEFQSYLRSPAVAGNNPNIIVYESQVFEHSDARYWNVFIAVNNTGLDLRLFETCPTQP